MILLKGKEFFGLYVRVLLKEKVFLEKKKFKRYNCTIVLKKDYEVLFNLMFFLYNCRICILVLL